MTSRIDPPPAAVRGDRLQSWRNAAGVALIDLDTRKFHDLSIGASICG